MLPYLIAGAIGFGIGKLFEEGGETFGRGGKADNTFVNVLLDYGFVEKRSSYGVRHFYNKSKDFYASLDEKQRTLDVYKDDDMVVQGREYNGYSIQELIDFLNKNGFKSNYAGGGEADDDLIEYIIPTWAVGSLINNDDTGLTDEEVEKIDRFVDKVVEQWGNAFFILGDDDDSESYFSYSNDIDNMGSEVMKLFILPSNNGGDDDEYKNGGEADMIYLISDNANPKREISISEDDILAESRKFFKWKNVSVKRIKSLGSTDYDKFIEFLYKKGYGKDKYAGGGDVDSTFITLGIIDLPKKYGVSEKWLDGKLKLINKPINNKTRNKLLSQLQERFMEDWENNLIGFAPNKKSIVWLEYDYDAQTGLEELDKDGDYVAKQDSKYEEFDNDIWDEYFSSIADEEDEFEEGGVTKKRRRRANAQTGKTDKAVDKTRVAKPVGYRFTNALASKLRIYQYAVPTEKQITKYLGKGIYKEYRKNKSDRDRTAKL
jgi:hypothetical protein